MNTPKVSVIIPTYNRADMVCKAIDSVLSQTYPNIELIVVDDGSTDDTLEMLQSYGERLQAISQPNGGASKARNTGLNSATGEFISFLDSDDYYLPEKIQKEVEYLDSHPNVDVVLCGFIYKDEENKIGLEINNIEVTNLVSRILWTDIGGLFPPNLPLFRRQILEKVKGFDEQLKMREEQDFWLRVALEGYKFEIIRDVLCISQGGPHSKGRAVDRLEKYLFKIYEKVFSHPNVPVSLKTYKDEIYARSFLHINHNLCMTNHFTNDEMIALTKKYVGLAFQNLKDISNWRSDSIDPLIYSIQIIDYEHPEKYLKKVLTSDLHPRVCSFLFSELYLVRAFQARAERNRGEVIKYVIKAIRSNQKILHHKGILPLLGHALLKGS